MSHDPFDIAGQEQTREESDQRAQNSRRTEDEDLRWLMNSKRGRRIVHRILLRAGVWHSSFNTNALTMAFSEGRRNEGLALTSKIMALTPENFTLMTTENSNV
jgi:hypothetical protein